MISVGLSCLGYIGRAERVRGGKMFRMFMEFGISPSQMFFFSIITVGSGPTVFYFIN